MCVWVFVGVCVVEVNRWDDDDNVVRVWARVCGCVGVHVCVSVWICVPRACTCARVNAFCDYG